MNSVSACQDEIKLPINKTGNFCPNLEKCTRCINTQSFGWMLKQPRLNLLVLPLLVFQNNIGHRKWSKRCTPPGVPNIKKDIKQKFYYILNIRVPYFHKFYERLTLATLKPMTGWRVTTPLVTVYIGIWQWCTQMRTGL